MGSKSKDKSLLSELMLIKHSSLPYFFEASVIILLEFLNGYQVENYLILMCEKFPMEVADRIQGDDSEIQQVV